MTAKYRCYLLDQDHITAVEVVEGLDDAAALIEADRILASSKCSAAEVWKGGRKVSIISRE